MSNRKDYLLLHLIMLGGCSNIMSQHVNDNWEPDEIREEASGMPRRGSTPLKEVTIAAIVDCAKHTNTLLNEDCS